MDEEGDAAAIAALAGPVPRAATADHGYGQADVERDLQAVRVQTVDSRAG